MVILLNLLPLGSSTDEYFKIFTPLPFPDFIIIWVANFLLFGFKNLMRPTKGKMFYRQKKEKEARLMAPAR